MKHKILCILLGVSALLTSCVQEEIENLGKIQSAIEPVIVLPESAILRINIKALSVDGKMVPTYAYAYPADEEFVDDYDENWNYMRNYAYGYVYYPEGSDVCEVVIGENGYDRNKLQPGKTYKVRLEGYIEPLNSASDILYSSLAYDVPDFTFTTPKDLYEAFGVDGGSLFDVQYDMIACMPTSALFMVDVFVNPGNKMSFATYGLGLSYTYPIYPGSQLNINCYSDSELTDCVANYTINSYNLDDNGFANVQLNDLSPDTDYYVIVESGNQFSMVYDYEQNKDLLEFRFDSGTRFNKEPFKFHTPKDYSGDYYVVTGNGNDWDFASAVKMTAAEDNDGLNFSYYSIIKNMEDKNWIIVPQKTLMAGAGSLSEQEYYVPVVDKSQGGIKSGEMILNGSLANASKLDASTQITIHFPDMTFSQSQISDQYYVTGSGWSNYGTHWMPLSDYDGNLLYEGFVNLNHEFKISPIKSLDYAFGGVFQERDNDIIYGLCNDSFEYISIPDPGFYFMDLNVKNWFYSLYYIKSVELVGGFSGWDDGISMTPSSDYWKWTAEATIEAGDGFKFRFNEKWDLNLGGDEEELVMGGNNLDCPSGTYVITLDLSHYPASCTMVKKQ